MRHYHFAAALALAAMTAGGVACSGTPTRPDTRRNTGSPAQTESSGTPVDRLTETFSVVEFRYPGSDDWYYAPQLRVGTPLNVSLVVTRITFTIPGFRPGSVCGPWVVGPGQTRDAFHEIYGEYEFTFDQSGARAAGGTASAVLSVRDGSSDSTITVEGPIVQGRLPDTYTGGTGSSWYGC